MNKITGLIGLFGKRNRKNIFWFDIVYCDNSMIMFRHKRWIK